MNIGFIGYGNMAKAIARQLTKLNRYSVLASSPSLSEGINKDGIQTFHDNTEIAKRSEVIVLSVKPRQMKTVVKEIQPLIQTDCLLISVAAGIRLDWLMRHFNANQPIIRSMPNTPSAIGMSATALIANQAVNENQLRIAEDLFSALGLWTWVKTEDEMDAFTALSGSGPAYMFLFLESLVHAATSLGLEPAVALDFSIQTCLGAIHLAQQSKLDLAELRRNVTSPGGTTAAALAIIEKEMPDLILSAMQAAKNRAIELGDSF